MNGSLGVYIPESQTELVFVYYVGWNFSVYYLCEDCAHICDCPLTPL